MVYTGAVVGQEAVLGECCVIAPNAVLNGRVTLGEGAYVGANATLLPELRVGSWATVGAGSAVMGDVPDGASAVGVPAEVLGVAASVPVALDADELAARIETVWAEVLELEGVDHDRNFFDAGGTSLRALRVAARLKALCGRDVPITDVFRYTTIRALASHLAGAARRGEEHERSPDRLRRLAVIRQAARA